MARWSTSVVKVSGHTYNEGFKKKARFVLQSMNFGLKQVVKILQL